MDLDDHLRKSVYEHIDRIKDWDISGFRKEVDFIDATVDTLDGFYDGGLGQALRIKAKKMHPSPKVQFDGPSWNVDSRARKAANWIDRTGAELADIMVVSNRFVGNTVTERRVMLSQTKFSKKSNKSPMRWKVDMHQYHLLHELPEITFIEPPTGHRFVLDTDNISFTTYSFASNFRHGFFNTTEKMREFMSSERGIKQTTYDPRPDAPYGFQVFRGILKRVVLGMYGETFEVGDSVSGMIGHMYEHASFDRGVSSNALSDGGQATEEDPGMAIVQVDLGTETEQIEEPDFDELDPEGPRL